MIRKFFKLLRYSALILIALLFLSFFATQLDSVKRYLLSFAIESFEKQTGYHIVVEEVEFLLPFEVKARGITVKQERTELATCDRLLVRINPLSLLNREVDIPLVLLYDVYLHKQPVKGSTTWTNSVGSDWTITVRHYIVKNLSVDACISEKLCVKPLNTEGQFSWNSASNQATARMIASVVSDSSISPTEFGCYLQLNHDLLSVELSLDEQEVGGIFFPDGMGVHGATELTSTVENWIALFEQKPLQSEIEGPLFVKIRLAGRKEIEGTIKGNIAIAEGPSLHFRHFEGRVGNTTISGALDLTSDLSLGNSAIVVDSADLSEFEHLFENVELEGKATFTITLQGTLSHPTVEVNFATSGMTINHYPLPGSNLHALATWKPDRVVGRINWLFNAGKGIEEDSHAGFEWVYGQHLAFDDVRLQLPGISVTGNVGATFPSWVATGVLQGEFDDLSLVGRLLRTPINGRGQFDATFNADESDKQKMDIDLHAQDFEWDGLKAKEAHVSSTLTNIFDGIKGLFSIKLNEGSIHQWHFDTLSCDTELDVGSPAWVARLATTGKHHRFNIEGTWSFDDKNVVIDPTHLTGIYDNKALILEHPFRIQSSGNSLKISPMLIHVDDGSLFTTLDIKRGKVSGTVKAVALPLDLFDPGLYEKPIEGRIAFEGSFYGDPRQLEGKVEAKVYDLTIPAETLSKLPPMQATLTAALSKEGLTVTGTSTGNNKTPLEFNTQLPVHLMLTAPMVSVDKTAPLHAEIRSSGPIAPLLELLVTDTTTIVGDCTVDLKINGTMTAPTVQGEVTLKDASFESPTLGTQFHQINAKIICDGNLIKLDHFSAEDGKISAKGQLILDEKEQFPYQCEATVDKVLLLNLDTMKSTVSGTLSLEGNRRQAALKGHIVSDKSLFSLPKKSASLSDHVEVTYINQTAEEHPPTLITYDPLISIPMTFNVIMGIPNTLSINDENLTSTWKGELQLGGEAAAPLVIGEIKLTNGECLLNGKEFDLAQGTIHFAGDPVKKTTLHVVASREINDIRVEIVLKGKVIDPDIALRSTPSLSQQEILSLVLFGKSPSEISPLQDEQLEQSLSNLKVDDYEPGFFDRVQKTLGVDRIDINRDSTGQTEDVSIHVGKYITKDIYLSLEKGLGDEPNSIGIEAKVMENVKLTVEGSDDVSGQVSLKWRNNY